MPEITQRKKTEKRDKYTDDEDEDSGDKEKDQGAEKGEGWALGRSRPGPTAKHLSTIYLSGRARAACLIKYIAL